MSLSCCDDALWYSLWPFILIFVCNVMLQRCIFLDITLFDKMSSRYSTGSTSNHLCQVQCYYNLQCVIFKTYQSENHGRRFYHCPRNITQDDWNFFRWIDEDDHTSSNITHHPMLGIIKEITLENLKLLKHEFFQIKVLFVAWIVLSLLVLYYM